MQTIRASHNITIEFDPANWRLLNGIHRVDDLPALVEAGESGIRCSPAFTQARRLPDEGQLSPAAIARVVVGWAPESRNWHLGLLLAARPDTRYKMRWCGLASWPSGPAGESADHARIAGQSLARLINRPLHIVPPPIREPFQAVNDTQPIQSTLPMTALDIDSAGKQIDLRNPPFEFEDWVMQAIPKGFVWQRRSRWVTMTLVRALVLVGLVGLFIALGIGTQTSGLAAVNPKWLPWAGIAVAGVLVVLALHGFFTFFTALDIVLDTTRREVRCQTRIMARSQWRIPFDSVAYVLLSQTPARPQSSKDSKGIVQTAQEIWLHIHDGQKFWPVVQLGRVEGRSHAWEIVRQVQKHPGRRPLWLVHYDTPAHHAAQVMARTLDTNVWLDIR